MPLSLTPCPFSCGARGIFTRARPLWPESDSFGYFSSIRTLVPRSQRNGASLDSITEHTLMRMYQDVFRHTPHLSASFLSGSPSTMPST